MGKLIVSGLSVTASAFMIFPTVVRLPDGLSFIAKAAGKVFWVVLAFMIVVLVPFTVTAPEVGAKVNEPIAATAAAVAGALAKAAATSAAAPVAPARINRDLPIISPSLQRALLWAAPVLHSAKFVPPTCGSVISIG